MSLSIDELESAASVATGGLIDFGNGDHRPGLGALVAAAATSPHAGAALDARVRYTAVDALASRLSSQAGWTARPGCLAAPLAPQLVVIGLPRSGTTALHQILAADPAHQWIPAWLAPRPQPRPARHEWADRAEYVQAMEAYRVNGPNPLHDVGPEDPEECLQIMRQSLLSMLWVSSLAVPDYHEWFVEQDERPSYRRYADNLRLIGADDTQRTWLLKNPSHTFGLSAMLEEFPSAAFIHIYRDPAETIVSGCSLIGSMGFGPGGFTAAELGAHRLRIWALAAERMAAARDAAPERTVIDVSYRQFIADPLGTVREIYARLGREVSPEAEAAMQQWVRDRPKDKHGAHRYAAEDFGLTTERIRERMAGYIERHDVS